MGEGQTVVGASEESGRKGDQKPTEYLGWQVEPNQLEDLGCMGSPNITEWLGQLVEQTHFGGSVRLGDSGWTGGPELMDWLSQVVELTCTGGSGWRRDSVCPEELGWLGKSG